MVAIKDSSIICSYSLDDENHRIEWFTFLVHMMLQIPVVIWQDGWLSNLKMVLTVLYWNFSLQFCLWSKQEGFEDVKVQHFVCKEHGGFSVNTRTNAGCFPSDFCSTCCMGPPALPLYFSLPSAVSSLLPYVHSKPRGMIFPSLYNIYGVPNICFTYPRETAQLCTDHIFQLQNGQETYPASGWELSMYVHVGYHSCLANCLTVEIIL